MNEDQLLEALHTFNGDTSRSSQETLDGLERAAEELAVMIDALKMQIDMGEDGDCVDG
jgi:uncharacterized protein YukE